MVAMRRVCIFCNQPTLKRSKEHVIPLWLQEHLGIGDDVTSLQLNWRVSPQPTIENKDTFEWRPELIRQHPISALLNGIICTNCNTGWMSRLETSVRPILVPLIENPALAKQLSNEEKRILARWTIKTAYAFHFAVSQLTIVPFEHPRSLVSDPHGVPEGVSLWSGHGKTSKGFAYRISTNWTNFPINQPGEEVVRSVREEFFERTQASYKISFQFRTLLLLVAYFDFPKTLYLADMKSHSVLYPLNSNALIIDRTGRCETVLPSDVVENPSELDVFHESLDLARLP